jgi:hypothetical protein
LVRSTFILLGSLLLVGASSCRPRATQNRDGGPDLAPVSLADQLFPAPRHEIRCDVDGDGHPDRIVLDARAAGGDFMAMSGISTLAVLDGAGRILAQVETESGPDALSFRQVVRDRPCEILVSWSASFDGGGFYTGGIQVWKWRAGKLILIASPKSDFREARFRFRAAGKDDEITVTVTAGDYRERQLWRWDASRFAFRLRRGKPTLGTCDTDESCGEGEHCDRSLVESAASAFGICAPNP